MRPGPGPVEEDGREVYYTWFTNAAYCPGDGLLYAGFPVIEEERIDFYALDPATLLIVDWYQMEIPGREENGPWPTRLVVEKDGSSICFYCLEMMNSGVMIIEPEGLTAPSG